MLLLLWMGVSNQAAAPQRAYAAISFSLVNQASLTVQ